MADPLQALFEQYAVRDPSTGRYFLPFENTYSGMHFNRTGSGFIGDGGDPISVGDDDHPGLTTPSGKTYTSLDDYFNALDPNNGGFYVTGSHPDGTPIDPSNAQNALVSTNATRGTFNNKLGYFFDPSSISGLHPATTSGGKPNETGLWQALSLLLPAVSEVAGFGAGGAAGSSAFGDTANVPAAAGTAGAETGSTVGATVAGGDGSETLVGGQASDTLSAGNGSVAEGTDPLTTGQTVSNTGSTSVADFFKGLPSGTLPAAALFAGSALQANAAKKAAAQQAAATGAAIGEEGRQFDTIRADQAPFREAGVGALTRVSDLLGTSPNTSAPGYGDLSRKFSVADFWNDPVTQLGYQSGLDLGTKALKNRAPLTTGLDSGAALKELTKFGEDYAGSKAADSFVRFEGTKTNEFNRLAAIAGIGQTANAVNANAGMTTGTNVAQLLSAQGNAQAASTIGQANAYSAPLNSVANWWQQQQLLSQLQRGRTYN